IQVVERLAPATEEILADDLEEAHRRPLVQDVTIVRNAKTRSNPEVRHLEMPGPWTPSCWNFRHRFRQTTSHRLEKFRFARYSGHLPRVGPIGEEGYIPRVTQAQLPRTSPESFEARRARLRDAWRKSEASQSFVLSAGWARPRNFAHNVFPFRAESHFLFLVGEHIEGALLAF